jgi:hypothetical protein
MGSKTRTTEAIRDRKKAPNKANLKTERKRIDKNLEVLRAVAEDK